MSIEDFDLTTSFFFTEKHAEEWNERLAYTRSLDKKESSEFNQPKFSIIGLFKGKDIPYFLNDDTRFGIYGFDREYEIMTHFPETKTARLYEEAFGYEGKRCYHCGAMTYPFVKPKHFDLCEECNNEYKNRAGSNFLKESGDENEL